MPEKINKNKQAYLPIQKAKDVHNQEFNHSEMQIRYKVLLLNIQWVPIFCIPASGYIDFNSDKFFPGSSNTNCSIVIIHLSCFSTLYILGFLLTLFSEATHLLNGISGNNRSGLFYSNEFLSCSCHQGNYVCYHLAHILLPS
jgi:hypothetical protein